MLLIGLGAATVTALTAGIFPARYSTSFNPAMVLKGSFSLSARGRNLRSVLVGVQYLISFVLIIYALFITLQVRYMKGFDMGYEREHISRVQHLERLQLQPGDPPGDAPREPRRYRRHILRLLHCLGDENALGPVVQR